MLYIINKHTRELRSIQPSSFQELGIWERKDLEKWVEDYPEILGEELFVVTTEYDQFDKTNDRLDVLAVDKNGKLVIIELKRDMAPAATELQAIKYAAFCSNLTLEDIVDIYVTQLKSKSQQVENNEAEDEIREFIQNDSFEDLDNQPRIILAAKEFRPETTSSVLWLRSFRVDIKCVKLEVYSLKDEIEKHTIAISPSVIIPLPDAKDFLIDRERKDIELAELTRSQKFRRTLFDRLIDRFKKECPGITERGGTKDTWLGLPVGYSNIHFEWTYRKRPKKSFHISLDFEKPNYEDNKKLLLGFEKDKEALEKVLNEKLIFDYKVGTRWCRLYVVNENVEDETQLDNWVIETTKAFYKILKPKLDKIMSRA